MSFAHIFEYRVRGEPIEEFTSAYGQESKWVRFFCRDPVTIDEPGKGEARGEEPAVAPSERSTASAWCEGRAQLLSDVNDPERFIMVNYIGGATSLSGVLRAFQFGIRRHR